MTANEAIEFIKRHGIVLMSARGPVPNLAQAIAGEPIRGSWWAHPRSQAIYQLCSAVCESNDVLVCKLLDGKVTFVHRRLWPALVRLVRRVPKDRLAAVREEHTPQGKHHVTVVPFPRWVPEDVLKAAKGLSEEGARSALGEDFVRACEKIPAQRGAHRDR